jgi:hypothetical protein
MSSWEYKVVPFVGQLKSGLFSTQNATQVSGQLESLINEHARQGWELVTINDVSIQITPGCLAGLFGAKTAYMPMDQVVFRRSV